MTAGECEMKMGFFSVFFPHDNDYIWKRKREQGQKFKKNIIFSTEKITFSPVR